MISPPISKTRDLRFDLLRAFAIWGVIWIHAPLAGRENAVSPSSFSAILESAFRWAVPVFLILSAFFSARGLQKRPETTGIFLRRRLPPLFWAFAFYSIVYWLISADFSRSPSQILTRHFLGRGWLGQYFFLLLFQLLPFYPLLARRKIGVGFVVFVFVATLALYLLAGQMAQSRPILAKIYDLPFFYWLVFPVFGIFLSQNEAFFQKLSAFPPFLARLILVLAPFLIPLYEHIFPDVPAVSVYLKPPVVVAAFLVILAAPAALKGLDGRFWQILARVGEFSLAIFCLNPLLLWVLKTVFPRNSLDFSQFWIRGAVAGLVVLVAYGIGQVLQRCGARVLVK